MGVCVPIENNGGDLSFRKRSTMRLEGKMRSMDEEHMKKLITECFTKFDKDGDGYLDFEEVVELIRFSHKSKNNKGMPKPQEYY
jgi:Ca2+-binding EF-hand superfamily protein